MNTKNTPPETRQSDLTRSLLRKSITPLVALSLALAGSMDSHAASGIWTGLSDSTWANTGNWDTSPVPGTGDKATFNGLGNGNTTIDLGSGVTVSNLLFDVGTAAYTIGSGSVGSQILSLNPNGGLTVNANNQLINANLSLATNASAAVTITNNGSGLLTLAGGITGNVVSGNGVVTIGGSGNTLVSGVVTKPGAGSMALLKTGAGQLTISTNGIWSGSGAIGYVPATSVGFPLVDREGTLLFSGGSNYVNLELVIGGVVANGGAGQNAKIVVDGSTLNVSSWFSIGRGNGIGGVSSDLVLTNAATVFAANLSAGFNGGNTANLPKGSITMGSNSTFTITGNGAVNFAESLGSDFTWTLNDSAQFIAAGTGLKHLGYNGKGTVNLNGASSMILGNQTAYIGRTQGTGSSTGIVNMASSGIFSVGGDLRVGGSQDNGAGRIVYGTLNISSGTVNLSSLTVGRGNNNQNQCTGIVTQNGGTVTSTNDVILGYAGTNNYGQYVLNNGTFNIGPAAGKWLMVGSWDFTDGRLDINGGTLNLMNSTSIKMNRQTGIPGPLGGNAVNQNGGTVNFYSDAGTTLGGVGNLDLVYSGAASSVNTYNLNGGTLNVPQIACTTANGSRTFNFNGGTLRAVPTTLTTPFMSLGSGTVRINVRNNGAIIDSNGRDLTMVQSLDHSDVGGDNATDGGLKKSGAGILTLAGGSSYTGPTIVTGGGLSVSPTTVSYVGTVMTLSNASLSVNAAGGSSSFTPTSLALQNNSVLNIDYGAVTANPTAPAINVSGSLTAPGSGIVINITGFGLKPGTFTLVDYSGTALANLANFTLGPLPPGVVATLVNNTANSSIDLNITSSGQNLTWVGTNANTGLIDNTWDIAVTTNWVENGGSAALRYQEYTTTSTVGDPVRFDDSVFNDFINPQPTNINLTTVVKPFSVTVDSTLPYMFSGAGSLAGQGSVVKSNTGSLFLATSNSHTGGTLVYGGSVVITNENALGATASKLTLGGGTLQVNANATNTTRAVSIVSTSTIDVSTNVTYQVGGSITGSGGLTKTDNGTLLLAGTNGFSGALVVSKGTLRSTGTNNLPALVTVGNSSGDNGILSVGGGLLQATVNGGNVYNSSLVIGSVSGAAGDMIVSGGTVNITRQLAVGGGAGAYAGYQQSGGAVTLGGFLALGLGTDQSVFNQTGGTFSFTNMGVAPPITIGAGPSGVGIMSVSGSAVFVNTNTEGSGGILWIGEAGTGVLNLSGSGVVTLTNNGVIIGKGNGVNQTPNGSVNLNGGTLTTTRVFKSATGGSSTLNFNGGTLKASATSSSFISGLDKLNVYSGGATVDDTGFTVTIPQAFSSPNDYGVSSVSLSSGGSGYIDAPIVTISGGSGSNTTAIATVANGSVTGITITSPGTGYTAGDALSVNFSGGGGANTLVSAVANTPVLAANVGGGLTKKGSGTVNLTGANTYSGSTIVNAGTLLVAPAHQGAGPVTVLSNAAFGVLVNASGNALVGNLTLGTNSLDRTTLAFALGTGSNPIAPVLQAGAITINGTNSFRLSGTVAAGVIPLVKYSSFSGNLNTNTVSLPQGQTGVLSNSIAASTIYAIVSGTPGIVWSGTNSVAALTNVWNINTTNWLAAGTWAAYLESTPPGDPVVFNDLGSGIVLLSNTVSPASATISNNSVAYTFSGTGKISGTTGLRKVGTGTVTLALSGSDYTGNTVVSNGTLKLGSATSIPDGTTASAVNVGATGTLDLNGFSETINGLTGAGKIDNSSTTASVLTLGNGNGSINWDGAIDSTGTGGISIIKVGTGAATITGTNYLRSTAASQINGGSLLLTNGASVFIPSGEFWVQQNAGTSSVVVAGATLVVSNNWFVIGRNNAAADATLTVNSGTVQKAGATGNIVVGSLNATGRLIVNGGQVLNSSMLWLGENASANATLQLNGGLVQATQVRPNNAVASSVANFNGGTLQATGDNPTNFLATTVTCNVQGGGAVIDDGGFTIAIPAALVEDGSSPGGGLIKKGSGTVYLDGANSYTGTTIVSNGVLGGVGSIAGPVLVKSGAALAPGDGGIGTLTLSSTPTLQGSVVMQVDRNGGSSISDLLEAGSAPLVYGGTLVVTNSGADLQVGDTFKLFNTAGGYSGSFAIVSQTPNQSITWNTSNLTVDGTITVAAVGSPIANYPTNITVSVSSGTMSLSWPSTHLGWILQMQTNSLSKGLSTNWADISGSDTITSTNISIGTTNPAVFFRLRHP